jgi:hypothetical protein
MLLAKKIFPGRETEKARDHSALVSASNARTLLPPLSPNPSNLPSLLLETSQMSKHQLNFTSTKSLRLQPLNLTKVQKMAEPLSKCGVRTL